MYLRGKKVTLRSLEHEDIDMLREMTNDPWYESMIVGWAYPISKANQEEWFVHYKPSDKLLRYIIETEDFGGIGMITLRDIDWKNGSAFVAIAIAKKEARSKGFASDAYMTLFRYAFDELRLNRIDGTVLGYNAASVRSIEKVGFKVEGVKRQAVYKLGQYFDLTIVGILRDDYYSLVESTKYWD